MGKRSVRGGGVVGLAVLVIVSALASPASAVVPRTILKEYFEKGDKPTQSQFSTLIDSSIHQTDDGLALTLVGIGGQRNSGTGPNGQGLRVGGNVGINELLPDVQLGQWLPPALHPEMQPLWAGQHGFLPLKYQDAGGQPYYGFLQVSMASALAPGAGGAEGVVVAEPPAIFVEYWAWETTPNTTLTTFFVPEPASIGAVAALAGFGLLHRARRVTH